MDKMTLDDFCKKLSLTDKRVELIGGFHHWMKNERKIRTGTEPQFKKYYAEFCTIPA